VLGALMVYATEPTPLMLGMELLTQLADDLAYASRPCAPGRNASERSWRDKRHTSGS